MMAGFLLGVSFRHHPKHFALFRQYQAVTIRQYLPLDV